MSNDRADRWFKRDEGDVHEAIIAHVRKLEEEQDYLREGWYRYSCLYDPSQAESGGYLDGPRSPSDVSENLIASNLDTVTAIAASTEVRPRFVTDGADWTEQRKAKSLGWYAEGIAKHFHVHEQCTLAFKGAGLKGTGLVKVWGDENKELRIEEVMVDDIIVDEREWRSGRGRQMHHRVLVDRDELADLYDKHRDHILNAQSGGNTGTSWDYWAGHLALESHEIVLIESWYLPRGSSKGRHTIVIDGLTLKDEEWTKPHFPIGRMVWSERRPGWYGIGGAERTAGHQRRINKYNWQLDRWLDMHAMPLQLVHIADANLQVTTRNTTGSVVPYRAAEPKTVWPPAMHPDMLTRRADLKDSAYQEWGTSQLAATAKKPAGLESGAALREYRDATTQRFALQEKAFERLVLEVLWLAIDVCKDLGEDAPEVYSTSARRRIRWDEVDMGDVRLQMQAASALPTTPAGRRQLVIELSQAGIVSQEEARRLLGPMDPLDVESALSLYTAALDSIDYQIEKMLDGEQQYPEPFQNLQLNVWRVQMAYLRARTDGAPEDICENLRQYITQAAFMLAPPAMPANDNAEVGPAMGAGPAMAPPMPTGPPQGQPTAALAPTAMDLIAG
jgi:hypothetical protein